MANDGRILVVEDDQELCSLICRLLELEGFAAEGVHSGGAALESISGAPPRGIVLDVMLPDLSGFEVCQKVKFRRETNRIPVLILTAAVTDESRAGGLRVGADRYLTKPFAPDVLLAELRQTLARREQMLSGLTHTAVELQMQSDSQHTEQLNEMLSELFTLTPLSDDEVWRLRYAVLEMIDNAIEWGNKKQKDLLVKIRYEVTDDRVKFVITDEGPGFDPATLAHAAKKSDPLSHMTIREKLGLRDGGFGILTAKGLVDEHLYNETGNEVTLVKYFQPKGQSRN